MFRCAPTSADLHGIRPICGDVLWCVGDPVNTIECVCLSCLSFALAFLNAGLARDSSLTDFYTAVCAAQPQPVGDGMSLWRLHSPHDASQSLAWPLSALRVLLERDFYARVLVDKRWLGALPVEGPQRKCVVLGLPGVGKSAFGWWLITQLLRSGRTVVYSCNSAKRGTPPDMIHYVFHRGVAFETLDSDLGAKASLLFSHPSVVHICDSCKPSLRGHCHKVMLSSPDPDMWRWFVDKEFADTAYFPLYSASEMEALRAAEYVDTLSKDGLALLRRAREDASRQVFAVKQAAVKESVLRALAHADVSYCGPKDMAGNGDGEAADSESWLSARGRS